jgi:ribosomal protein S12 methylthiotransferase accessory factor
VIGLPVFSSVRPAAMQGSLCVNAGKGLSAAEARVGAYMEAIEFAAAEPPPAHLGVCRARVRDVLDGRSRADAILDLCPLYGRSIALEQPIDCVSARDLEGREALVPAELVYFPYPLPPDETLFGATTNGLASGATLPEATLHGLLEVIERDIASFAWVGRPSQRVAEESLPARHREIIASLRAGALDMAIRWLPNEFGIACFQAILWERRRLDPVYMTDGFGCHLDPTIALTRAVTEAVQGRLSFIHGARDDIQDRHAELARRTCPSPRGYARALLRRALRRSTPFYFEQAMNKAEGIKCFDDCLDRVRETLHQAGIGRILRVRLTAPDFPVAVVRVVVPLLEYFTPRNPRVGRRLAGFVSRA